MELVLNAAHFRSVVVEGICAARVSVDVMTADFKTMLVPLGGGGAGRGRQAESIVRHLRRAADRGVEVRMLHAGVPSSSALRELRRALPTGMTIRRCPRLHSKAVILDAGRMYFGSANLTGAGLGAKADGRRNFELGVMTARADWIDEVSAEFNRLWEGRYCRTCRRRDVCPVPLEEPALGTAIEGSSQATAALPPATRLVQLSGRRARVKVRAR